MIEGITKGLEGYRANVSISSFPSAIPRFLGESMDQFKAIPGVEYRPGTAICQFMGFLETIKHKLTDWRHRSVEA
jgi:hypothetical protein